MFKVQIIFTILLIGHIIAQEIDFRIDGPVKIVLEQTEKAFMKPRWSPDGTKIAFTGLKHIGLYVINSDGSAYKHLSEEPGAGYDFYWSPDSRMISTTVNTYINDRQKEILKVFDVFSGSVQDLGSPGGQAKIGLAGFIGDNALLAIQADRLELINVFRTGQTGGFTAAAASQKLCLSLGTDMALYNPLTGEYARIDPKPGALYLTPVLSPDSRYIALRIYGDQMYVYDIENGGLIPLGEGHHPRWANNSEWIVFERNTDDGHSIISADLFIADKTGQRFGQLTYTPDELEVNPDWSPVANQIVYENLSTGAIHLIEIADIR